MLVSLLSKVLAGLLVLVALSAITTIVTNQTLMSSTYMKQQLKDVDGYTRLSDALSQQIAKQAGVDNAQAVALVQQVVTPEVLQQRIDPALTQMEAYYKGEGPPPRIEVGDLATQAQAAGIPISLDAEAAKPIVLAPNSEDKPPTKNFNGIKLWSMVLAGLLLVAVLAVSLKTKRYTILPNVAIICGVLLGLLALLLTFSQGVVDKIIKFDSNTNAFAAIGHDLAASIAHDLGQRYGIIATILLLVGIGTRVVLKKFAPKPVARPVKAT